MVITFEKKSVFCRYILNYTLNFLSTINPEHKVKLFYRQKLFSKDPLNCLKSTEHSLPSLNKPNNFLFTVGINEHFFIPAEINGI